MSVILLGRLIVPSMLPGKRPLKISSLISASFLALSETAGSTSVPSAKVNRAAIAASRATGEVKVSFTSSIGLHPALALTRGHSNFAVNASRTSKSKRCSRPANLPPASIIFASHTNATFLPGGNGRRHCTAMTFFSACCPTSALLEILDGIPASSKKLCRR